MRVAGILCFILVCMLQTEARAQFADKCDMAVLEIIEHGEKHSEATILNFLYTIGAECHDNVEFSEWSNELLFNLLYKQSQATLTAIEKNQKEIELNEILDMLSNPVVDSFDLQYIESAVLKATVDRKLKKQILQQIAIAIKRAR